MKKYITFHEISQSIRALFWGFLLLSLFFGMLNFGFTNGIAGYFSDLKDSETKTNKIFENICKALKDNKKLICTEGENVVINNIATDIEIILAFGGGDFPIEQIPQTAWDRLKNIDEIFISFMRIHGDLINGYKNFLWYYPDRTFPTTEELADDLLSCRSFRMYLDESAKWECPKYIEELNLSSMDKKLQKQFTKDIDIIMNGVNQSAPGLRKGTLSAYNMRRVWSGFIQWLTVWLALSGLIFLCNRSILYSRERRLLEKKDLTSKDLTSQEQIPLFLNDYLQQQTGKTEIISVKDELFEKYVSGIRNEIYKKNRKFNIVRIINSVNNACLNNGRIDGIQVLDSEINQAREEMISLGFWVRFVMFAVPTIGFVGTVLGISDALGGADRVLSAVTNPLQIAAVQSMTVNLSLAFDTTLVALLLSIPLTLASEIVSRREDENLTLAYQIIMDKNIEQLEDVEKKVISTEEFESKVQGIIQVELEKMLTNVTDSIKEDSINSLIHTLKDWSGKNEPKN